MLNRYKFEGQFLKNINVEQINNTNDQKYTYLLQNKCVLI